MPHFSIKRTMGRALLSQFLSISNAIPRFSTPMYDWIYVLVFFSIFFNLFSDRGIDKGFYIYIIFCLSTGHVDYNQRSTRRPLSNYLVKILDVFVVCRSLILLFQNNLRALWSKRSYLCFYYIKFSLLLIISCAFMLNIWLISLVNSNSVQSMLRVTM